MANTAHVCPSCGSASPANAEFCDICGHDLRIETSDDSNRPTDISATDSSPAATGDRHSAAGQQSPPSPAQRSAPRQVRKSPRQAGKKDARKSGHGASDAQLFNTPQWVAITVAAFILGGVVGASFVPAGGGASGDAAQMQAGAQPDLQRLNAAREALDANPDDPAAILVYANALHDSNMPDQAIVQYKRYLEFDPDNPDARVDLGICYFEKRDFASAIVEMERAVAKHPDHQLGNYNLGIVNLNAGNKDKAREWFEKARDLNPASPHGQNAIQLLEEHF
jgi:tetratricopeptide (TPR) repeat protein